LIRVSLEAPSNHFVHVVPRETGKRGRDAEALDRAQQSPTRAEIQGGVAVKSPDLFERIGRSHDFL
jgi:hypothetical protein